MELRVKQKRESAEATENGRTYINKLNVRVGQNQFCEIVVINLNIRFVYQELFSYLCVNVHANSLHSKC